MGVREQGSGPIRVLLLRGAPRARGDPRTGHLLVHRRWRRHPGTAAHPRITSAVPAHQGRHRSGRHRHRAAQQRERARRPGRARCRIQEPDSSGAGRRRCHRHSDRRAARTARGRIRRLREGHLRRPDRVAGVAAGERQVSRRGPVGVGVIGAGVISDTYLENMTRFPDLAVLFVADLDIERARQQAQKHGIASSGSVDELLAIDEIEIVVNLTIPSAHVEIDDRIIAAGKNVWSEKPLALGRDAATELLDSATAAGVRVACAPDTVLGAGVQSALRAIARGDIGEPLTATATFQTPGPELWHPNPDFLFAHGAGPLLDMGPYYITTLVHAFGPVAGVSAISSRSHEQRSIGSGPRQGQQFPVEVPTHHAALVSFESGQSAQATFSFQNALHRVGVVEISGTEGTIVLPDPNTFEGDSILWRFGNDEPAVLAAAGSTNGRGSGVVDLARALRGDRTETASGALAGHVLDTLLAISDSAETGTPVAVTSTVAKPQPLPEGWDPTAATLN
ncbi:Gfo/Idh/MocA family oxidoreductase [Microbacteriaceae bacterium VKM Ac-2855]|nr:Gfo/Idh/MocA family oxidoreductase [Microbacteriaceae bacterium VKM Ac-2855]